MFFAKIPRHTSQNAITEGDLECILTRNCEGTEQLRINEIIVNNKIISVKLKVHVIMACTFYTKLIIQQQLLQTSFYHALRLFRRRRSHPACRR